MSAVFLDTVGLLAIWDEDDQWHRDAISAHRQMLTRQQSLQLITTTFILLECGNAACRRPYRDAVERLRNDLEIAHNLVVPTESDWQLAWACHHQREGNSAGIVDCVSFVVMRRLGIKQVFSNDEHFRTAGFETLF
jgi:uncharacterized protein